MNHKITALVLQKRNRQRVNVYLDGEFAFGLARILATWLKVGQEISDEKIALLRAEDGREVAYLQALKFLSYRPRSEAEVRQNLHHHEVPDENITEVTERLKRSNLLDDASFAQAWVENRNDLRPRGRRLLAYELKQRGVEPEAVEHALEAVDDEKLAFQAALKHSRKLKGLEWKEYRLKIYRHLAQRGFSYDIISEIAPRAWAETHATQTIPEEEETL